jgi:DNA-directed RNA polymerase subunit delta
VSSLSDNLALEKIRETAMVDLAYNLLKEKGDAMIYREIMDEIAKIKGFTEEDFTRYIAQLYTEINIDGRFVCVGRNLWGLREWYPIEQATDSAVAGNIKEDDLDDELDSDLYEDEDEDYDLDAMDEDDLDLPLDDDEDNPFGELDDETENGDDDEEL